MIESFSLSLYKYIIQEMDKMQSLQYLFKVILREKHFLHDFMSDPHNLAEILANTNNDIQDARIIFNNSRIK